MTDRRTFLAASLAVVTVGALPALAAPLPVLYGDGVHDDAPAFRALFEGRDVVLTPGCGVSLGEDGSVRCGGKYLIGSPVPLPKAGLKFGGMSEFIAPNAFCVFYQDMHGNVTLAWGH